MTEIGNIWNPTTPQPQYNTKVRIMQNYCIIYLMYMYIML